MNDIPGIQVADLDALDPRSFAHNGAINDIEEWWVNHRDWLEECGYKLRPRYQHGWQPSWNPDTDFYPHFEDGQVSYKGRIMDAVRQLDGVYVVFKKVPMGPGVDEVEVNRLLSSPALASDPANHSAPLLDVLEVPDEPGQQLIVMPQLRPYNNPEFESIGEAIAFFHQIFEGLQFMHQHHIAHRDCTNGNIALDPSGMYPESFHPHPRRLHMRRDFKGKAKYYTRTQRPPRYLFIDFGLSRIYPPELGPPIDIASRGGDKSAPEHIDTDIPCNPLPTDVHYLGNLIRQRFIFKYRGFSFMRPLVDDMVAQDPDKRPQMDEVVMRFKEIRASVSSWKLRSRMVRRDEAILNGVYHSALHWHRRLGYILTRKPAIPDA
ncbi:hypothetical protein FA95DRAFT_1522522 [Auriscalpium vulgare]|uniref:Uncharacterized protein n=1 Tax=Auriscalpium vulgare TaxID=40419 RepID=A0ACB8RKQ3_9AGAM|nr:hypothetical protein FA95DRAFT_1522522 [Auriscalpium vulgare]